MSEFYELAVTEINSIKDFIDLSREQAEGLEFALGIFEMKTSFYTAQQMTDIDPDMGRNLRKTVTQDYWDFHAKLAMQERALAEQIEALPLDAVGAATLQAQKEKCDDKLSILAAAAREVGITSCWVIIDNAQKRTALHQRTFSPHYGRIDAFLRKCGIPWNPPRLATATP